MLLWFKDLMNVNKEVTGGAHIYLFPIFQPLSFLFSYFLVSFVTWHPGISKLTVYIRTLNVQ